MLPKTSGTASTLPEGGTSPIARKLVNDTLGASRPAALLRDRSIDPGFSRERPSEPSTRDLFLQFFRDTTLKYFPISIALERIFDFSRVASGQQPVYFNALKSLDQTMALKLYIEASDYCLADLIFSSEAAQSVKCSSIVKFATNARSLHGIEGIFLTSMIFLQKNGLYDVTDMGFTLLDELNKTRPTMSAPDFFLTIDVTKNNIVAITPAAFQAIVSQLSSTFTAETNVAVLGTPGSMQPGRSSVRGVDFDLGALTSRAAQANPIQGVAQLSCEERVTGVSAALGGIAGAVIGREAGAEIGAVIGSPMGPVGAMGGAVIGNRYGEAAGAAIGGYVGLEVGGLVRGFICGGETKTEEAKEEAQPDFVGPPAPPADSASSQGGSSQPDFVGPPAPQADSSSSQGGSLQPGSGNRTADTNSDSDTDEARTASSTQGTRPIHPDLAEERGLDSNTGSEVPHDPTDIERFGVYRMRTPTMPRGPSIEQVIRPVSEGIYDVGAAPRILDVDRSSFVKWGGLAPVIKYIGDSLERGQPNMTRSSARYLNRNDATIASMLHDVAADGGIRLGMDTDNSALTADILRLIGEGVARYIYNNPK